MRSVVVAVTLLLMISAAAHSSDQTRAHGRSARSLDDVIYYEDWESGTLDGWVTRDWTNLPSKWHLDTTRGMGGSACWWMGDPAVGPSGGYLNDWLQGLDSPPVLLGTNPVLHFWQRYGCEDSCWLSGYDAWDGMNLRISTNNGVTWSVIPGSVITPTYPYHSIYAFGSRWSEGRNIPGWSDTTTGAQWREVTVDLSAWTNQAVRLRWVFASDENVCTIENPGMFGWMVDNIRVYCGADTLLSYTDLDSAGWSPRLLSPIGGDLWRIAVDSTSPAGPHILVCNESGTGLFHTRMYNSIESPFIDLRSVTGTITPDILVTGSIWGDFPEHMAYWGMEVTADSGRTWCAVSNPTCRPTGPDYVYIDVPPEWSFFDADSVYLPWMDFTELSGEVIKFRIFLRTGSDAILDTGPKFDGFVIRAPSAGADSREEALPREFSLSQNYPNPFNSMTEIRFDLPKAARVELKIFNSLGQTVATLVDGDRTAGRHAVMWDARGVASGVYVYQLKAGSFTDAKKMLLLK